MTFKTELGTNIFRQKYASNQYETWSDKAHSIVNSVCGTSDNKMNRIMEQDDLDEAYNIINNQEFFPGGDTYGMRGERQGSTTTATY